MEKQTKTEQAQQSEQVIKMKVRVPLRASNFIPVFPVTAMLLPFRLNSQRLVRPGYPIRFMRPSLLSDSTEPDSLKSSASRLCT